MNTVKKYKALFSAARSKLVVRENEGKSEDVSPFLSLKLPDPSGIHPGRLSTTCSPGYNRIVVLLNLSLSNPL